MVDQVSKFDDEIDLGALIGTLWRGKAQILLFAVLACPHRVVQFKC